MRVDSLLAARGIALASLAVAALLVAGCAAPTRVPAAHAAHVVLTRHSVVDAGHVTVLADLTYGVADGVPFRLDLCLPPTRTDVALSFRPAIVAIHGGSWMMGNKSEPQWRNICEWLASSGYVVASIDYRLAPRYVYPAQLTDAERAVAWLRAPAQTRRFGIDPTLIGAFGGSAGGNLAAMLGTAGRGALDSGHRVAAVVELSGPTDLTARGAEEPLLRPRVLSYLGCVSYAACPQAVRASPLYNVDSSDSPFFIISSTAELIPLSQSLSLVDRLRAAHVRSTLVTVPGALHSISILTPVLRNRIVEFFRSTLAHHLPAAPTS